MKRGQVFIKGYYGFGDNIFLYPFIKEACKNYKTVYFQTCFPFLFDSLPNIKFVKSPRKTTLRTCEGSLESYPEDFWADRPADVRELHIPYYLTEFKHGQNLIRSFNTGIPISDEKINFDLPLKPEWINNAKKVLSEIKTDKKICLIKPPSDRIDWRNSARVPKGEYFQHLIDKYKDEFFFITVANRNIETKVYNLQNIDLRFEYGELDLTTIIAFASLVDAIIAYNCFFFPLGIAVKTKTFIINGGYTDPNMYVDNERMDLSQLRIVTPMPCCTCQSRNHKCNKEIDLEYLDSQFESLYLEVKIEESTPKQNLLICRMRAKNCVKIAKNPLIKKHFNIFTVDHTPTHQYLTYGNLFKASYQLPSVGDICRPQVDDRKYREIYKFCKDLLQRHEINLVINAQPLHPHNKILTEVCNHLGIKIINSESFFDDKWLFDWVGCQYVCPNEIYEYVDKFAYPSKTPIELPQTSRQDQPNPISGAEFFNKYKLNSNGKYIVLLGQLMWDMSVKKTVNPEIKIYEEYIDLVINSNPNVTFIFKPHPLYFKGGKIFEMKFIKKYPNVVFVNESLETLFNLFDYFTSFSSTTIFEGIIRNKKFATIGFHFCNHDDLVLQLRINHKAQNLYDRLKNFRINPQTRNRYIKFICNYYGLNLFSPKLYYRLTMSSEDYFKLEL
ncbi:MAG: hypothetical protein JW924_03220 [Fusobacteriaceae bacterium]|nr:hypothetical protein [Fusobacteriaceae bacterium]